MEVQVQKRVVDPLFEMALKYARDRGDTVPVGETIHIPEEHRVDKFGNRLTRPAAKKRFIRLVYLILAGRAEAA